MTSKPGIMERKIITGGMTQDERIELENSMYYRIKWKIEVDGFCSWHRNCGMTEFFTEFQEIHDGEGRRAGVGFVTGDFGFVLNHETEEELGEVFAAARDRVCREKSRENFMAALLYGF